MIRKILFTLLVAGVVLLFYKIKNSAKKPNGHTQKSAEQDQPQAPDGRLTTGLMAYIMVGFMLLFSVIYFALNWLDEREVLTIRVSGLNQPETEYKVQKQDLKGRTFTTTDGRVVELGDSERMEILPQATNDD